MWEYVIRFPNQNTLNKKVKQIRNPQKEISGGFFYFYENKSNEQSIELVMNNGVFFCLG